MGGPSAGRKPGGLGRTSPARHPRAMLRSLFVLVTLAFVGCPAAVDVPLDAPTVPLDAPTDPSDVAPPYDVPIDTPILDAPAVADVLDAPGDGDPDAGASDAGTDAPALGDAGGGTDAPSTSTVPV